MIATTQDKQFNIIGMPESFEAAKPNHTSYEHYYNNPSGVRYASVTTVFSKLQPFNKSPAYTGWLKSIQKEYHIGEIESKTIANYISKIAMGNGTDVHELIENYLMGNEPKKEEKIPLLVQAHFDNIKPLLHNIDNIRACEVPLYSDYMKLAGTSDCIAEYNGVLSIIDFKTSNKKKPESHIENYYLQATAYAKMFEERTCQPIEQFAILITSNDGSLQSFVKNTVDYEDLLYSKLEQYEKLMEENKN